MKSTVVAEELVQVTAPQNRSLLPNDLEASTRVLSTVIDVLEDNNNNATDAVSFVLCIRNSYCKCMRLLHFRYLRVF